MGYGSKEKKGSRRDGYLNVSSSKKKKGPFFQ